MEPSSCVLNIIALVDVFKASILNKKKQQQGNELFRHGVWFMYISAYHNIRSAYRIIYPAIFQFMCIFLGASPSIECSMSICVVLKKIHDKQSR